MFSVYREECNSKITSTVVSVFCSRDTGRPSGTTAAEGCGVSHSGEGLVALQQLKGFLFLWGDLIVWEYCQKWSLPRNFFTKVLTKVSTNTFKSNSPRGTCGSCWELGPQNQFFLRCLVRGLTELSFLHQDGKIFACHAFHAVMQCTLQCTLPLVKLLAEEDVFFL